MLNLVMNICQTEYEFEDFLAVADYFKNVVNTLKQMNYEEFKSDKFMEYQKEVEKSLAVAE